MKDEALRLALEALENSVDLVHQDAYNAEQLYGNYLARQGKVRGLKVLADDHEKAITAIKAVLEAKDEPAAWMYPDDLKRFETSEAYAEAYSIEMVSPTQGETVPLYTTPLQRNPLTYEELESLVKWYGEKDNLYFNRHEFARAIEAAHGIKGEA